MDAFVKSAFLPSRAQRRMLKFSRNNRGSVLSLAAINGDDQRPGRFGPDSSSGSGGIADNIEYPQPTIDKVKPMHDRKGTRMAAPSAFGSHMTQLPNRQRPEKNRQQPGVSF